MLPDANQPKVDKRKRRLARGVKVIKRRRKRSQMARYRNDWDTGRGW